MADVKIIGKIHALSGNIGLIDTDGNLREASYEDLMYDGEQIYSDDVDSLLQIEYFGVSEIATYEGVFRVLAGDSVIATLDGKDNLFKGNIDTIDVSASEEAGGTVDLSNIEDIGVIEIIDMDNEEKVLDTLSASDVISMPDDMLTLDEEPSLTRLSNSNDINSEADKYYMDEGFLIDIPAVIDDVIS